MILYCSIKIALLLTETLMPQDMFSTINSDELTMELLRQSRQAHPQKSNTPTDILEFQTKIKSPENLEPDLTPVTSGKKTE